MLATLNFERDTPQGLKHFSSTRSPNTSKEQRCFSGLHVDEACLAVPRAEVNKEWQFESECPGKAHFFKAERQASKERDEPSMEPDGKCKL